MRAHKRTAPQRRGASVDCSGSCAGSVTPPSAKAECQASAKADASVNATCTPPQLNVKFTLAASVAADATASASFSGWLEGFKGHISNILALKAKLDGVASAATDISATGSAAITGSINASLKTNTDLKSQILLACALKEVPDAISMVTDATTTLTASATDAVSVLGTVGLGS